MPEHEHQNNQPLTGGSASQGRVAAADAVVADPFLRTLVRHAGDGISVKDLDGRFLMASPGVAAFFGLADDALIGKRDVDVLPPAAAAREREMDRLVAETGQPTTYEDALELWERGDPAIGTLLISVTKFPYFAEDGRLLAIVGMGRDITGHKRLEAQLGEAEKLAGLGSWAVDLVHETTTWSDNFFRLYGLDPATAPRSWEALTERVRPADRARIEKLYQDGIAAGSEAIATDYEVIWPDGTARLLHGLGRVQKGPDGRPYRVMGTIQDVTDARAAQQAMARGHALLKALMDASEEGMLVVDEHHAIISHNRRFRELFDVPEALLEAGADGPVRAHVAAQMADPAAFVARVDALYATPLGSGHDEIRLRDGRVLDRFTTPLVALGPVSYGRVWFFRDISRRKELEDALRAQNERLRELGELKTTFINSLSHDLRTPLTAVIGYAEFLEDGVGGELGAQQTGFVREIVRNAKRLEGMVDDLLDVARMEAGTFELRRGERDVAELAAEAIGAFRPQADAVGVALVLEAPAPVPAQVDGARLERVFANLVGNALKFTPRGGAVRVRVEAIDGAVRAEVLDTGRGIPAEERPKLFQRFSQLDHGRAHGGTGLGLFISRTIVEAHGGTIGVESEPGAGACFWFELPAGQAAG